MAGGSDLTGDTAGEGFGNRSAGAGDVDGDGYDDLIVGAWQGWRAGDLRRTRASTPARTAA
jgi:hypothetical protein